MPIGVSWLGGGEIWDLTGGTRGVKILGGMEGLLDPAFVPFWTERLGDGDRYRGSRLTRRAATLRLQVGDGSTGDAWRAIDSAWWACVQPDEVGFLDVRTSPTAHRYLRCRLARPTGTVIDFDPSLTGYQLYEVEVVADDPWWLGDEVSFSWIYSSVGSEDFYGGASGGGLGPPYFLSPSGGFGEQLITNEGDLPAGPRWVVTGPLSSASLTVDAQTIDIPTPLTTGQSIYIETDPPDVYGVFTESKWDVLTGSRQFGRVPVGGTVPVTVQVSDPGAGAQVTMSITPRYRRAW